MCGGLSLTRQRRLPMMGNEGRLGGDLFPGTNPFIFFLRYSTARVTADNRHEQRSHGRMSGSDIVSIHSTKCPPALYAKQHCPCVQAEGDFYAKSSMPPP